jgi:hypothetical protein
MRRKEHKGYALLVAVVAINILALLALLARPMWQTENQRDLEEELLFRARQYKTAIELYTKKNPNLYPRSFDDLYEKKFLRQLFKDPMTESGEWNIVMAGTMAGKNELMIVPAEMLDQYLTKARIVGVCSASEEEGFKIYRGKKRYSEWAVYVGEQLDKEMPDFKFVTKPGDERGGGRTDERTDERSSGADRREKE